MLNSFTDLEFIHLKRLIELSADFNNSFKGRDTNIPKTRLAISRLRGNALPGRCLMQCTLPKIGLAT